MKTAVLAFFLVALALPGVAAAGPTVDPARARAVAAEAFEASIPASFAATERAFQLKLKEHVVERAKQQRADDAFFANRASPRAEAFGDAPATPIAEIASVAIRTEVEGATAGVTFAPLALLGDPDANARNATLTFAALEGGEARIGAAYAGQSRPAPMTLTRLGFEPCPFEPDVVAARLRAIVPLFADTCTMLAERWREAVPGSASGDEEAWIRVAGACNLPAMVDGDPRVLLERRLAGIEPGNVEGRVAGVLEWSDRVLEALPDSPARVALAQASAELDAWITSLPTPTSCIKTEDVTAAIIRERWRAATHSWSVSTLADVFARKYGFNPADNPGTTEVEAPLTDGQLKVLALKGAYGGSRGPRTWTAAVGVRGQREAPLDSMEFAGTFELGVESIAFSLDRRRPVLVDGLPNLDAADKLPAHVVAGLKITGSLLGADPEGAELKYFDRVDTFEVTPYLDFKFSETITFRLGIPVRAEILTRAADAEATPPVTARRGRQWTVPVFITAAIPIGG